MEEGKIVIESRILEVFSSSDKSWDGPDILTIPEEKIKKLINKDKDPFFVIIEVVREGISKSDRRYTRRSVEDIHNLNINIQGYLGHQKIENRDHEYRNPHLKVIKSRLREESGVLINEIKGYVSKASKDLRIHIDEEMAGPVSIDAVATLNIDDSGIVTVSNVTKLRSIDFANPGTEGFITSGVKAIVREMEKDKKGEEMSRLSKKQLKIEYADEIQEIIESENVGIKTSFEGRITEMDSVISEKDASVSSKDIEIKGLKTNITEMELTITEKEKELKNLNVELSEIQEKSDISDLELYKNEQIQLLEVNDNIKEMLNKRVESKKAGTLDESKEAIKKNIEVRLEDIREIMGDVSKKSKSSGIPPKKNCEDTEKSYREDLGRAILTNADDIYGKKEK